MGSVTAGGLIETFSAYENLDLNEVLKEKMFLHLLLMEIQ